MKNFNTFSQIKNNIKVIKINFDDLTEEEIDELEDKILNAGQMIGGVRNALKKAKSLFLMKHDEKIIGISAIKTPDRTVTQEIINRMGLDFLTETEHKKLLEFGLTLIDNDYRGMKLVDKFYAARIEDVHKNFSNFYCFCTIRMDNLASQNSALRNGFEHVGNYQSLYGSHYLSFFRLKNNK